MTAAGHRRLAGAMGALAVLLAACDGDGTGASRPASVVAASPTAQTTVVGTAVAQPPAVRVTDASGQPMAGVAVTFAVTGGGGTLAGTAATTSDQGVATAGTWTLGTAPGQNTVAATVGDLAPVQFVATAQARTATSLVVVLAPPATAPIGSYVYLSPEVRVNDQLGAPLGGVPVTFAVTGGGGGVNAPTQVSGVDGRARPDSWQMGPAPGVNTLTATVAGVAPLTFTVTAYDPCTAARSYTPMTLRIDTLQNGDCRLQSGHYVDVYTMALPAAQPISLRQSSSEVDSWLEVYDADGYIIALNDDGSNPPDAEVNLFAPAGSYFVVASSYFPESGRYELSSNAFQQASLCRDYWVVPGTSLIGSLAAGDCTRSGRFNDRYQVILRPGQQLTVRMETAAFDPVLEMYEAFVDGSPITVDDNGGGGTAAQITVPATNTYRALRFVATAAAEGATGAYGISFTSPQAERAGALRASPPPAGPRSGAFRGRFGERKARPAATLPPFLDQGVLR